VPNHHHHHHPDRRRRRLLLARLEDNLLAEFCGRVLEKRLMETLRFRLGSIYSGGWV
jgi:hypothetical protein